MRTQPSVLLLSGGGQWGAFGAGFLSRLAERGKLPNYFVVTGVSTGGLQAMFAGSEHPDRWKWLRSAYTIDKEKEVVDRNSKLLAVVTGSFAGLKPLRQRIEKALCSSGTNEKCTAIEALKETERQILIGYIEARSGNFYYSNIQQIAEQSDAHNSQQCITATALASSAMPVTFQQVRINQRTYYDGGVRQSVFANFAERLAQEALRTKAMSGPAGKPTDMPLYVIRNGPTALFAEEPGQEADASPNALTAAQRAQAIVTNQIEVGSVASLRLQKPRGPLFFISADGWESHPFHTSDGQDTTCGEIRVKAKGKMFDPDFMGCLMSYGESRADQAQPWRELVEIDAERTMSLPAIDPGKLIPANDN